MAGYREIPPDERRCTARSKQRSRAAGHRERCKNWDRPIPGVRVCWYHGGKIPNVIKAALRKQVMGEIEASIKNAPPVDNPWEAAAQLAGMLITCVDVASDRVGDLRHAELDGVDVSALERFITMALKAVTDLSKLDLDERRVRVTEAQTEKVATALKAVLDYLASSIKEALPPEYHPQVDATFAQFPTLLRQHINQQPALTT